MKNFILTLFVLMAFISQATGLLFKDSLVIRQRRGPDKTKYKVCKGADVKVVFYENNHGVLEGGTGGAGLPLLRAHRQGAGELEHPSGRSAAR